MALLETTSVAKIFGGIKAVQDFTIHIDAGELIGLIGPNGAGKTTAFNLLTGVYRPSMGEIRFDGQSLLGKKPYQITAAGIARTFQNIRLFGDLSVLENVKIACNLHARYTLLESVLRVGRYGREEEAIEERALQLLQLFNLDAKRDELARNLPYGEQRRLEIARALATKPRLLLLDEPAAGMNPQETAELTQLIRRLRDEFSLAILLIEHDMGLVMQLCERIYVLDYGKILAHGVPDEIRHNPDVIKAYLGAEA